MSTKNKRFMLTVSDDIVADAAVAKRDLFYDKPYSEMYRQLIRIGLNTLKSENEAAKNDRSA